MDWKGVLKLIKELSGSKNTLTIHPVYCRIVGDSLPGGMFLAQCIYWTDKGHDPDGWFYKTYDDWQSECFLSKHEVKKYADLCVSLGFLETEVRKVGRTPKVHYRINLDAFALFISSYFSQSDFPNLESENLESENLESENLESPGKLKNGKSMDFPKMESPIYTSNTSPTTTSGSGDGSITLADVYKRYENNMGFMSEIIAQSIADMCDEYAPGWVYDAIGVAVENEKRNMAYVGGILKRWKSEGRTDKKKPKPTNGDVSWVDMFDTNNVPEYMQ